MDKLDITLSDPPNEGILKILAHIRPKWDKAGIYVNSMKGGHVNHLYVCGLHEDINKTDVVIVRKFGEIAAGIVDRQKEILAMRIGYHEGLASQIYCTFNNGIVYKYQQGCKVDFSNQTNETITRQVAKHLAKLHLTDYRKVLEVIGEGDKIPLYKSRFQVSDFMDIMIHIPESYEDPKKEKIRQTEFLSKADVMAEIKMFDECIDAMGFPLEFCHNDLNTGNIIYDEAAGKVHFVDWEVANLCYSFFDVGIFFFSHAYMAGLKCDPEQYTNYPSKEYQLMWIRWYLEYKAELSGEDPKLVTEDQVQRFYTGASLTAMTWSLIVGQWTLLQDIASPLPIDFFAIARHMHGLYWLIKTRLKEEK